LLWCPSSLPVRILARLSLRPVTHFRRLSRQRRAETVIPHTKTQPLKPTTGIPAGGNAPIDQYAGSLTLTTRTQGGFNDQNSYVKPIEPITGYVDTSTIAKPGQSLGIEGDRGIADDAGIRHFPPSNLWNGSFDRQKSLEHYDIMPIPISGPSTEVTRPVQQANYTLPSTRWTGHSAPPVFRYTREYGQRFQDETLPGFLVNDGRHMSMAQSYGANRWIRSPAGSVRVMNRNNITPRNVPTLLDDQVVNVANRSRTGSIFSSYREMSFMP
jgi:hypothetical protein